MEKDGLIEIDKKTWLALSQLTEENCEKINEKIEKILDKIAEREKIDLDVLAFYCNHYWNIAARRKVPI
ncbi:MAG: hypothetical protein J6S85_10635 [Methanobrevibacter sp.]|nr:hypothetical protein [Methanobrevibacter sp.]